MALNSDIFAKLVAMTLPALANTRVASRLVSMDHARELAKQGDVLNIPIPGAITATDVTPANVPPVTGEPQPTTARVTLDNWKEAAFTITDRDLSSLGTSNNFLQMQIGSALESITDAIDQSVLALYQGVPYSVGTPGTNPFNGNSTATILAASQKLTENKAPKNNRNLILDPAAYNAALGLPQFQATYAYGSSEAVKDAVIPRALGFNWHESQNVRSHVKGVASGTPVTVGTQAIGAKIVALTGFTANTTGILNKGDVITFAGSTQTYTVLATANSGAGGATNVSIYPALKAAVPDATAVTVANGGTVNIAFDPAAFTFVSRDIDLSTIGGTVPYETTIADPQTGVVLRLMIVREHYQMTMRMSCLWGVATIRPELAVRVMG
jgi:hypothetical protein